MFTICLASAPSGSGPGCIFEMLKLCLDDAEIWHVSRNHHQSLHVCDNDSLAETGWPQARRSAGWLRRRWPVNSGRLWKQFVFHISSPSPRAGTDCVGHAIRAFTDADPQCTVLSIDGVGAYDHVLRSSFLQKLHNVPSSQEVATLRKIRVRSPHDVCVGRWHRGQAPDSSSRGGRTRRPSHASAFQFGQLRPEDKLFAFFDDVHVVSPPHRTRGAYSILEEAIWSRDPAPHGQKSGVES